MFRIIAHVASAILTILIIHQILPDEVHYQDNETLLIFAVILGLVNAFVLPIVRLIALPLTCLTLGLFALVITAAAFYFSSLLLDGVEITYLGAGIAALIFGVLNGVLDSVVRR
jgi:putative membrane protein